MLAIVYSIFMNFNIYEFRLQTSNVNSVMRFCGGPSNYPIIDLNRSFNDETKNDIKYI